jgi:hypothetical protein
MSLSIKDNNDRIVGKMEIFIVFGAVWEHGKRRAFFSENHTQCAGSCSHGDEIGKLLDTGMRLTMVLVTI